MNNPDYALDCVHEAFEKALEYINEHPRAKISDFLLTDRVIRAAKKDNKHYSIEIGRILKDNDDGPEQYNPGDTQER